MKRRAMVLGIDTATEWLYLALAEGASAWARRLLTSRSNTASIALLLLIEEMLLEAKARRSDISGIAACIGPGGFTSLRAGIATAEGLAALGLPTWGFSSFELRALALIKQGHCGKVCLALDGQRQEVFFQAWDLDCRQSTEPARKIPLAELNASIRGRAWWTPERFRPDAERHAGSPAIALGDEGAAALDALSELCRICPGRPAEEPLAPFYLRETDAEVNFPAFSAHLKNAHRQGEAR
jgi:tRNA threonylcarbamoyladenosine biosynthesis protein TsaB